MRGNKGVKMRRIVGLLVVLSGLAGSLFAADVIPTDFTADYMELDALKAKLAKAGLNVLGTHQVAGNKDYSVVVYSSPELLKAAKLPKRGFIGALHILHDSKAKQIVASNPEYYMRAFLQKDYKSDMAKPVNEALKKALGKLTPTADGLKAKTLKKYKFMVGMPHYDDFVVVGKGKTEDLLKKLRKNAKVVFEQKLNEDGTLVLCGVELPEKIEKFNVKLKTMGQSHLLPYSVVIGGGKARILHAKFYLAVSFPRLTMGEFMKIMSVPGDIKDAFKKYFK